MLLDDFKTYIINNNLQGSFETWIDTRPDQPDSVICLFEYSGDSTQTGVEALSRNIQLLVRAFDYDECRNKINQLFNEFDQPVDRAISLTTSRWTLIAAKQPPFKMEVDALNRQVMVFNMIVVTHRD